MKRQKSTAKSTKKSPDRETLSIFAAALREALDVRGISNAELARRVDRSPSAISNYTIGRDVPPPAVVFAIEDALGLGSGFLSRMLGYCPCDPEHQPPRFEDAVMADAMLAPEHKKTLLGLYKGLTVSAV